jgi:hypothetical protein
MLALPFAFFTVPAPAIVTRIAAAAPTAPATPAPVASGLPVVPRVHADRSFTLALNAPPDIAIAAFGPLAEREWSPGWNPAFVYPALAAEVEGAVFTVGDASPQVWLLQTWDTAHYLARYVILDPNMMLVSLDIAVEPATPGHSKATIRYQATGLSERGDARVGAHFGPVFADEAPHWETALNAYFAAHH